MTRPILLGEDGELALETRTGKPIPNIQKLPQAPEAIRAAVDMFTRNYPGIRVRSLSSTYNCAGLVFATRRTGIEMVHLPLIMTEDGYKKVLKPSEVRVCDIVIYRKEPDGPIRHIGIVVELAFDIENATPRFQIVSQWGYNGEYLHEESEVPTVHYGSHREYWTERES